MTGVAGIDSSMNNDPDLEHVESEIYLLHGLYSERVSDFNSSDLLQEKITCLYWIWETTHRITESSRSGLLTEQVLDTIPYQDWEESRYMV